LIATAVTVPLVVLVALAIGALNGGPGNGTDSTKGALPPISASAPPQAGAEAGPCAKVLAELPVQLGRLDPRVVHTTPDTPFVVAWGDPAVVFECGADKPKVLRPGSSERVFNAGDVAGPYFIVSGAKDGNVYTVIDRQPYISITIPAKYQAGDLLPTLIGAVGKAVPPVCSTDPNTPDPAKLCTRRSS
jgi:hypothetical protein